MESPPGCKSDAIIAKAVPFRQTCRLAVVAALVATASPLAVALDWEAIEQRIDAEHLDQDAAWLALGHYRSRWLGRRQSQADGPAFFLSPQGKRDPHAELLATARALLVDTDAAAVRCRFPARDRWLRERFGLPQSRALQDCAALRAWLEPLAASAMSIEFASAYLENPSSMFGHTFLRFHVAGVPPLLQPTINYAADSSQRSGAAAFIVEGLFGGFPGVADQLPYFRRVRIYSDNEGRDLWDYPLQLAPREIELLLLHLWEIKGGVFDYYFLDENCSYRTLDLIAATRPDLHLMDPLHGDVVPIETLKVMRERGLLGAPAYWPSAVRTLDWHTRDLSREDLRTVRAIATGAREPDTVDTTDPQRRAETLRAAAELQSILVARDQIAVADRDRIVPALIRERLKSTQPLDRDLPAAPPSPDVAHAGHTVSAAWIHHDGENGVDVGYAAFQHTLTDPLAGFTAGAAVTVLGGHFRFTQGGGHRLENFDVLRVASETPSTALLSRTAWNLSLGAQRKWIDDDRPLVGSAAFAAGRGITIAGNTAAMMLGGSLDAGRTFAHDVAFEGEARLSVTRQAMGWSYQAFASYGKYLLGDHDDSYDYGLQIGVPLHGASVQLSARRKEFAVELRKYF